VSDPRAAHAYAPFYCEENVWHLAGDDRLPSGRGRVVFISGSGGHVAVWRQRAATTAGEPVIWDYHVVLLVDALVYDLDTTLPFPVALRTYLGASFPEGTPVPDGLRPRFRVIDAAEFRATFASDRSHMKGSTAAPPAWPCIRTARERMNLDRFTDVTRPGPGELLDREALGARA
jgi:hypothetical protein